MSKSEKNVVKSSVNKELGSNKTRRNLLLGGAAGAALGAWHKPIVNSIVTPAHAQTTNDLPQLGPGPFFSAPQITQNSEQNRSLLDVIIPHAYAGEKPRRNNLSNLAAKVTPVGPDQYEVEIRNGRNTLARIGTLTVGVAGVLIPEGRTCQFQGVLLPDNAQSPNTVYQTNDIELDKKGILDYLIPEAQAGTPVISNSQGNSENSNNGHAVEEIQAISWVCTIVSVNETEVTLDIPLLTPQVDTIPAGDGMLPALITDCELVIR